MTVELVASAFAPRVGERFEIAPQSQGEPFSAVLTGCEESQAGFALLFHADPQTTAPQQICVLRNDELGEVELFLVPLGPDARGMRYEAVIS